MSVRGSPSPASSQSNTALTSSPTNAHRCVLQRAQNLELALQLVGLEKGWRAGTEAHDDLLPMLRAVSLRDDRQHDHLCRMPEVDAVESFDPHVLVIRQLL